mgnify:CR=1 FL=1
MPGSVYAADMPAVLVVEDDVSLADMLALALEDEGFEVRTVHDGSSAVTRVHEDPPALVLLDVGLPKLDGFSVCRQLRQSASAVPIIMVTSRDDEIDKVLGLDLGADDYVTKPFVVRELMARVRAVLRRTQRMPPSSDVRSVGGLLLDRAQWRARYDARELTLTTTEFDLLWALVEGEGNVCPRDALIEAVYGPGIVVAARTIDTFVKRIRRKIGEVDPSFESLETVRGVGYRYKR